MKSFLDYWVSSLLLRTGKENENPYGPNWPSCATARRKVAVAVAEVIFSKAWEVITSYIILIGAGALLLVGILIVLAFWGTRAFSASAKQFGDGFQSMASAVGNIAGNLTVNKEGGAGGEAAADGDADSKKAGLAGGMSIQLARTNAAKMREEILASLTPSSEPLVLYYVTSLASKPQTVEKSCRRPRISRKRKRPASCLPASEWKLRNC